MPNLNCNEMQNLCRSAWDWRTRFTNKASPEARYAFDKIVEEQEKAATVVIIDDDDDDGDDMDIDDDIEGGGDADDDSSDDSLFPKEEGELARKKPKLEIIGPTTSGTVVEIVIPKTQPTLRKELCVKTLESKDKLFIIAFPRDGFKLRSWHVVQVCKEDTDWRLAKRDGLYHVRFLIRCLGDSRKMKVEECRYWPELHQLKADGETMGAMVPSNPEKTESLLLRRPDRYMWYQDTIPLFKWMVSGPFDYHDGRRIPTDSWKALRDQADARGIYIGNLGRTVPLDKPDRKDTNLSGAYTVAYSSRTYPTDPSFIWR
ncbi:MAG: hypothetical protein SGARI_003153 [Bacillariaceae sp.]